MITVKCLVLVEEVAVGDEAAIDVAVFEVDGRMALVLDVGDFFTGAFAEAAVEDEKLALAKNHAAAEEGGVACWLSVQDPCHLIMLLVRIISSL